MEHDPGGTSSPRLKAGDSVPHDVEARNDDSN
jgi:hypothetical protein